MAALVTAGLGDVLDLYEISEIFLAQGPREIGGMLSVILFGLAWVAGGVIMAILAIRRRRTPPEKRAAASGYISWPGLRPSITLAVFYISTGLFIVIVAFIRD
jgi:hypothetical protein